MLGSDSSNMMSGVISLSTTILGVVSDVSLTMIVVCALTLPM